MTSSTLRVAARAALLLLVLSPLPSILSGCGTQAQNAIKVQNILSEAKRHAQVDPDDKQARVWADRAVAVAPQNIDTYVGVRDPTLSESLLSIAAVFDTVGDDAAMADYMQQAALKFPDDERPLQRLDVSLSRLGRTAEMKASATKLAALSTKLLLKPNAQDIVTLTVIRAQALWDSGDIADGTTEFRKALQAYPTSSLFPNGLAYNFAEANTNLPEALTLAQQALILAQRDIGDGKEEEVAQVQDTLGWVQHQQGDNKNAEQNLQEAAGAMPRQPEIRLHLGVIYAAQGKTDAARSEFNHALLISKDYFAAKQALATLPKSTASARSAAPLSL